MFEKIKVRNYETLYILSVNRYFLIAIDRNKFINNELFSIFIQGVLLLFTFVLEALKYFSFMSVNIEFY